MDIEKVIKGLEQFRADLKPFCGNRADWEKFDAGLALLKEQEAIVHCKDCKDCHIYGNGYDINCSAGHNITYIDGFCSEGKKRATSKEEQLR